MSIDLVRRMACEALGTAFLLAIVIGSGIMGDRLAAGEFVATFGLLVTIWGTERSRPGAVPFAVGAYITSAYWFTSSTSLRIRRSPSREPRATRLRAFVR